jgi:glycosyltransferase involved in cell wall biosynthesis
VVTRLVVRGVPRHVLALAAGLDPDRFQVEVVAGRGEPGEGSLAQEAAAQSVRVEHLPTLRRAIGPVADLRALLALYRLMRARRYDLVHTHISKAGILGRAAARLAGVPAVVHTYHGQVSEVEATTATGVLFRMVERMAARVTHRIIAVSASTAEQCLRHRIGRPDQYRVIHNGIDLDRFGSWDGAPSPEACGQGMAIGFVGSLAVEKRVDVLIGAVALLQQAASPVRLYIVGDGPLRHQLEAQALELGLGASVHFTGLVPDVRPWLAAFDVVVAPSASEGLPTVLLEAQAMGCPIVASRVGGIPEIVEDGVSGLLVEPEQPRVLSASLAAICGDSELRRRLGMAGRGQVARSFGLTTMLRRTEGVYDDLLAGPGKTR